MLYLNVTIKHLFVKTCQVCVSVILMHSHEYSSNLVFERIKKKTNNNNNSNNNHNKIGPDGSLRRRRLPTRQ